MCRILYALNYGMIASKLLSADWAKEKFNNKWVSLIERVLAWHKDTQLEISKELMYFSRLILEYSKQFEESL